VVLLLPQGSQVSDGHADQPRHRDRLLEGHRQGQGDLQGPPRPRGHEEDARLLHGEGPQGWQDRLGHARVPPPRQACRRRQQQQPHAVGVGQSCRVKGASFCCLCMHVTDHPSVGRASEWRVDPSNLVHLYVSSLWLHVRRTTGCCAGCSRRASSRRQWPAARGHHRSLAWGWRTSWGSPCPWRTTSPLARCPR